LTNYVIVSGGGSLLSPTASDPTTITPLACNVTSDQTTSAADVRMLIKQALGTVPATFQFTTSGIISVADVQVVTNAAMGNGCQES
jgi:hypothetical protein